MPRKPGILGLAFILLSLTACEEDAPAGVEERVRAIKSFVVSERAGADLRRFSGSLVASDTSGLAFPVSGTVQTVTVVEGDRVEAGQVLATLDTTPFDLNVQAAQAELSSAKARFSEMEADLARQRQLFDKGWVARAAIDQAQAAYDSAAAELNLARTRLGSAQRDLDKSILRAPFDGVIAERSVEAFEEVQAGSSLFQVNSDGVMETVFSVPDTLVGRLSLGTEITVDVRTIADCGCNAVISEIGSASGAANTVTVKASLLTTGNGLLPGMASEVIVPLSDVADSRGFLVPITAIAPGDETAQGYVFVFDPESETVSKIPVTGGTGVDGNYVEVAAGLKEGDILAAAGVSFLRDGQRVKRMSE